jgi:hypothetical protein
MNDLKDLFKVVSEGKKHFEETSIIGKTVKETKQHVKEDLTSLFAELASLKEGVLIEEVLTEVSPIPAQPELKTPEEHIKDTNDDVSKYMSGKSFQQPNPDLVEKNVEAIQNKIKFLEQAIGKIAATGPGSGEVNFRYLDDVNRSTMTASNDNWVLEYDVTTKKVQFTKDIGPIDSVAFDITHVDDNNHAPGTLCWNVNDKTLNLKHEGDVSQQIGQEQYYPPVKNLTGATITNGTVCMFSGAESDNGSRLLVTPMVADGTYPSLYAMGVATQDIPNGQEGFVTVFGYVNDIDTTAWNLGDILYADPVNPGQMTNIKPTSPNNVVPIAAVVKVDVNGRIMVRPTVEQKMLYARFSSLTTQNPIAINTPYSVVFEVTDVSRGFHADGEEVPDYSKIYAEESGYFKFDTILSLTSTNSSSKAFYVWLRKNGVDVPNSAKRKTISGNGTYDLLAYTFTVSLDNEDYIQIIYAVDDTTISINSPAATAFSPTIPAASLVCTQIAL